MKKKMLLVVISFCSKLTSARQLKLIEMSMNSRVFVFVQTANEIETATQIKKCFGC